MTRSLASHAIVLALPLALALAGALAAPDARSEDTKKKGKVDFEKHVKPVLEKACVGCHGPTKQKGDYRLDSKDAAYAGGEHVQEAGKKAIVPGKSAESMLVAFITAKSKNAQTHVEPMPPAKAKVKLTPQEVELIKLWIDEGAVWPDGVTLTPPPEPQGGASGGRR